MAGIVQQHRKRRNAGALELPLECKTTKKRPGEGVPAASWPEGRNLWCFSLQN